MSTKICIVGLGYVGLPLAHAFAKAGESVVGFDTDESRIQELKDGIDRTNELTSDQLKTASIEFSNDPSVIKNADVIILAIPTPVDDKNEPDLSLLKKATENVGSHMKDDVIVVYESTVYPGVTEEICKPILKESSGGKNFKLGYSPERINPGDKEHTIDKIVKVVAGENEKTTNTLVELYGKIAPVHRTPSIKVAEMSKAIENAQRDLNIAYINEIAMLCGKLGISTKDVLDAAGTKWNFLPFSPGLVGGHCIGVDPYYLLEKAKDLGMKMDIVTASRATNDGMAKYISDDIINKLKNKKRGDVLVLGLTFKENVPDTRNSKTEELANMIRGEGFNVKTHDPYVTKDVDLTSLGTFDAIALLVPHKEYLEMPASDFAKLANNPCLFYDLKSVFKKEDIEGAGMTYLSL